MAAVAYVDDAYPTRPADHELTVLSRPSRRRGFYRIGRTYGHTHGTRTLCPSCHEAPFIRAYNALSQSLGTVPSLAQIDGDPAIKARRDEYSGWRTVTAFDLNRRDIYCTGCGNHL